MSFTHNYQPKKVYIIILQVVLFKCDTQIHGQEINETENALLWSTLWSFYYHRVNCVLLKALSSAYISLLISHFSVIFARVHHNYIIHFDHELQQTGTGDKNLLYIFIKSEKECCVCAALTSVINTKI